MKICIHCNKKFSLKSRNHPFQRFCSKKCQVNNWIETHPLRMKELAKAKRKRCHKQRMAYNQKWRLKRYRLDKKYRQYICAYNRNYRKTHPEIRKQIDRKMYAKRKKAIGSFSLEEWNELKKKCNYKCLRCGKKKKLTVDHIYPLSKGGTNYISNIQPLCLKCNAQKGAKVMSNK